MTPEESSVVLAYFTEAWPYMAIGDDTAVVWADALAGIDAQDAHTAARRLVQTEERPPPIARLIAVARGIAAGHLTGNALPAPRISTTRSGKLMSAINAYWTTVPRPAHDHRRGDECCPACSTSAERIRVGVEETTQLIHDYQAGRL